MDTLNISFSPGHSIRIISCSLQTIPWESNFMWHKTKDGLILFGQFTDRHLQCPWACRNNEGDMIKWQSSAWYYSTASDHLGFTSNPLHGLRGLTGSQSRLSLGLHLVSGIFFFYFPGTLAFLMSFTHQPHSSRMEFALVLSLAEMLFAQSINLV